MDNAPMPHSRETELLLIGALISNENWFEEVADLLDSRDFSDSNCAKVWTALSKLYSANKPFDLVSIAQLMDSQNYDGVIKNFLIPLATQGKDLVGSWNISEYGNKIRELSERRKLAIAGQEISKIARMGDYGSNRELFDQAERALSDAEPVKKKGTGLVSISELAVSYWERLENRYATSKNTDLIGGPITGIPSGLTDLDAFTCGFQEQELIVIGARPSVGKTAFALNILNHAAEQENTYAALFSLEMDKEEGLMNRITAFKSNADLHQLRSGDILDDSWPKLTFAFGSMPERFFVDDTPSMTMTYIKRAVRRLRRRIGPEAKMIIAIDYLQRIKKPAGMSRYEFVTETVIDMKELARECRCPIIALSQLTRGVEQRQNKRPMLSDIRESGQVEQEADVVAFLHRDDYYDAESDKKNIVEIIIAKNRNAPKGTVEVVFLKDYQKFLNLEKAMG